MFIAILIYVGLFIVGLVIFNTILFILNTLIKIVFRPTKEQRMDFRAKELKRAHLPNWVIEETIKKEFKIK